MYHNIDKSAYRKGEYTGYANGAWKVSKSGKRWQARKGAEYFFGDSLRDISEQLTTRNAAYAQELRAARLPNPFAGEG
jgi:hypothetical protein